MSFITNFDCLNISPERKIVLDLIETAFSSIQPHQVVDKHFILKENKLVIMDKIFDLQNFKRVFLIGFGKGSAGIAKLLEDKLADKLTQGYVIDIVDQIFDKVQYTKGTHPLPSEQNLQFTQRVTQTFQNITEKDLVLVVICGGGSVMFEHPYKISFEQLVNLNKALLHSGATISEMNTIRKHLSSVKGGGLAKTLYPATVASLIFSDVPGNDLSVIASGPTVKDPTTLDDALKLFQQYNLKTQAGFGNEVFLETPKQDMIFQKVHNILMLSNLTALHAMEEKAKTIGFNTKILSDKLQGNAKDVGGQLIKQTLPHTILLVGGETTDKITGNGRGGRNQELVLAALPYVDNQIIISSFDSDGWDNDTLAGALVDMYTKEKAEKLGLDPQIFLDNNNTLPFFQKVGDGIVTGRLESNVSDLMIVLRK